MTVLVIVSLIILVVFASVVAITIAHDNLPLDKTPEWLEDAYYFIWDNLEKVFLR